MNQINNLGISTYTMYSEFIDNKRREMVNIVENKGPIVWVIIIMIILSLAAYAFYCTASGYNFDWGISYDKGNIFQMGVRCTR